MREIGFITYGRQVVTRDWQIDRNRIANRLYMIHSGEFSLVQGQERRIIRSGYLYFFPQNLKFEPIYAPNSNIDHTYFDFYTLPEFCMDHFLEIDLQRHPKIEYAAHLCFLLAEENPMQGQGDVWYPLIQCSVGNLLTLIGMEYPLHEIHDARINTALEYIHRNETKQITLEELATLTFTEKNYFLKLFKRYLHTTPHQYIMKRKLSIALREIACGATITDAAFHIGYANVSAFSEAVKKSFGVYPNRLRDGFVKTSLYEHEGE